MQGLHHQQQQLAGLLAVATASTTTAADDGGESSRIAALNSLHRAILFAPNSVLVAHSAAFLSQGLSTLLSDKSSAVRQAAATVNGALCSIVCSISISSSGGRQNHVLLGNMVDRFISWAGPLVSSANGGEGAELALESLREFLNVGDAVAIDRYVLPILKACQELVEDERTSSNLLHRVLGVLTLISLKFSRSFQPHFVDIVDLLLGWALVPDLADLDRCVIMDSFLQFQKHWVNNLQFSLDLLSKFLGDMDVLVQDKSPGTAHQFRRLLALLSCFLIVLQSTTSGMLEMNLLEQIPEPLSKMVPQLLECLSMVGTKFGWSRWVGDLWRCLALLAEILCERFSTFYPHAVDVLFKSLGAEKFTSLQVHGVLKTNLQLLSSLKRGLLPSSVHKILQFEVSIAQLRLHPNHLVTASSAATYIFLLQHENNEIVDQVVTVLTEELLLLKNMLGNLLGNQLIMSYSKNELVSLIKFDLKVLQSCIYLKNGDSSCIVKTDVAALCVRRSNNLTSFIIENLDPFYLPIQDCLELQVDMLKTLSGLTAVKLLIENPIREIDFVEVVIEYFKKYNVLFVKAFDISSPLPVKLEALEWIRKFCEGIIAIYDNSSVNVNLWESDGYAGIIKNLIYSVLDAAWDREPKVRFNVALILELLLQARLIHPIYFHPISEVILEKLGDPDDNIKNAYVKLLSNVLPITMYTCGLFDWEKVTTCRPNFLKLDNRSYLHWKQVLALKQLHRQLRSQQLVSILSYISQRWKVPLSSWVHRLIYNCKSPKENVHGQSEESGDFGANIMHLEIKVEEDLIERIWSVNDLVGAFWAIHEAARYCVSTRLRTNLGGPTQTFAALERMLLDIAHLLQLDTEQNDGNLNILGTSSAHLLPMRLLLDFVEALKKNVYNAYDGSIVLPCATRQSSLFFRANKKVCEEWFSRICDPMMNVGLALHCHEATIHYCTLRLQELRNHVTSALKDSARTHISENIHNIRSRYAGDILRVLRHMALSLCRDRAPESLIGLQKWVSLTFSSLFIGETQSLSQDVHAGPFSWITGLVYQAGGQHEKAVAHFTHLLQTEDSLNFMNSEGVQFAIARIIESYTAVSDWKSLESWLLELQTLRAKHTGKSYSGALTTAGNEINSIHALARFDEGDFEAAWAFLDLTPKSSSELTLDSKLALQRSEQMLLQAMLYRAEGKIEKVSHEIHKAKSMLEEAMSILPLDGLPEAAPLAAQFLCISAFEEGYNDIQEKTKSLPSLLSSYLQTMHFPIYCVNQDCSPWLKVLRVYRTIIPTCSITLKLSMDLLRLARKQKNLGLANRLFSYIGDNVNGCDEGKYRDSLITGLQYEGTLLMHAENKHEDYITNLWSFVRPCIFSAISTCYDSNDSILKAKACLRLAIWLRNSVSDASAEKMALQIQEDFNVTDFSSIGLVGPSSDKSCFKPNMGLIIEEIIGTLTKFSSCLCPTMGKSWILYASWCYNQARASLSTPHETVLQLCSFSPFLSIEVVPDRYKLTEKEKLNVESVILQLFHKKNANISNDQGEDWNYVNDLVKHTVNIIEAVAGAPGAEKSGEPLSASLASQLLLSFQHANVGLEETEIMSTVNDLVDVWWSVRRRRVSLFGQAAYGFIQYLSYSSAKIGKGYESLKQKNESYTLRATLYVLQILLNFGVELKDTLESHLSTVPLLPWQEITPQMFARLSSHPEQVIRKQLEGLLMRLAKQSPWTVVYPTLVEVNAYGEGPSEELQHLLACLAQFYPRLIQDVQLMINELGNVTVLWEELWLSTLQELHIDVMRRVNLLKEEAGRIAENITLSHSEKNKINAAKYSAMMAPIVVALERRLASTSRKPETPHEIWFHETYGEQLKSAILIFKSPPGSTAALADVWGPFDSIALSLVTYQRKSSISLGEVAPLLALLSSSDVPMPGLEKRIAVSESENGFNATLQGIVTISSFSEQVEILSTKTKPKKIVILGSDGQKYTYLLKGREDLRLDARIMQLLQAINGFLHSSSVVNSNSLAIRYYSVTPISGRAGLIQWVDNVISIYSVYKSWQNRVNTKDSVPLPVPRPSDMFYGKIIPALKEKGIRRVISRRDWPHDVKRKVLLDLMKETPRQLLYQELWCASEGFRAFSLKLKRYSGTLAAMSMVGHVLGLGDRHLDNILMDLYSGDIVHIDYNVCFDKGQRLKIPEIVPFRLTQMMEATLGLTGVEGIFRANCEAVLGVLRKNKDILLMLLEVFVWDPLVEWTRGDFHDDAAIGGEERKGMELAVSLSLFASRVQEIRVPLQEHHDLLLATLPAVKSALERFADVLTQYELVSAFFCRADEERSNLILHETSAKSIVTEATGILEKTSASYETQAREFSQAKATIVESAQEATTWMEQHGRILDALRSGLTTNIYASIKLGNMDDALSLTSAVLVSGVPLTIVPEPTQAQCQDIDTEVSQLINDLDHGLSCAVTSLQEYSLALQRILPLNYITTSPVHGWVQVLQLASSSLSIDVLALVRRQAAELIEKEHGDNLDSRKQFHNGLCLKVEKYELEIKKVEEDCAELENSIGPEAESKAKDRLLSAFKRSVQKTEKVSYVLNLAVTSMYSEAKHKVLEIFSSLTVGRNTNNCPEFKFNTVFCELEKQVEKCILVAGFVNEIRHVIGRDIPVFDIDHSKSMSEKIVWASIFKSCLLSCKSLAWRMTEDVLPDVIRSVISLNSIVMDAFGPISQIRGSIDMALEHLIEVEIERASLTELEQNYFVKVGLITEQQLTLQEAAETGRDTLSWEEAEELASQEEACRAKLHQLHQTWNQKDMQASLLNKREASVKNAFITSLRQFQSLTSSEEENESHVLGSKALLGKLVKPFSELESVDKDLSSFFGSVVSNSNGIVKLADLMNSGYSISDYIWNISDLLSGHSFFIWKVGVVDSFLDSCIHEVATHIDQNLGFDQLFNAVKKKMESQVEQHICRYLRDRVVPALFACLDKEIEHLAHAIVETKEVNFYDQVKKDNGIVRKVELMLEEYCNAHESARAARSAVSYMKRQVNELKEALCKTSLEIIQMEWMHDNTLTIWHKNRSISQKFLSSNDKLCPFILNLSRPKLVENIQSSISKVARSVECLQACERTSVTAEAQLERAMGWACGGPSPPEFHDHLMKRRQLIWEAREKASDIIKVCMSLVEFEVSRDGIFQIPGQDFLFRSGEDARIWQQTYVNSLSRLDVTYRSFTCTEQEWKLAQSSMEAASNDLISATKELSVASEKAKSASGDLQSTVLAMRDSAYDANVSLSTFSRVMRGHTALTSECGSMLEEVLTITEGLHDVHNLGKEAAGVHRALMEDLSKANSILLPLELVLSKDVAAMTDAMSKERETKMELSPIHGQAIYQSYCLRIREVCQAFKPLVPPLTFSVKGLHSLLTRLARTASLHAGNLHKALEGLGDSQEVRSQEISLSRPSFAGDAPEYDSKEGESFSRSDDENTQDALGFTELSLQDNGWISPPDSMCVSSSESDITSTEASLLGSIDDPAEAMGQLPSKSEATEDLNPDPLYGTELQEISESGISGSKYLETNMLNEHLKSLASPNDEFIPVNSNTSSEGSTDVNSGDNNGASLSNHHKIEDRDKQILFPNIDVGYRVSRGKNPYAVSILRRVEMKIDGQDIADNREVSVVEQVDYLLRQATSVDNLCNMYEGWTPWI